MLMAFTLLFATCKKDETINYNSASGQLTAGKTVTALDLKGLKVFLWKVQDGIDITKGTVPLSAIAFKDSMTLGQNGAFAFNNLEKGNYLLNLTDGYLLGTKKMSVITIDGKTENRITLSVEKAAAENVDAYPYPAGRSLVGKNIKRHRFDFYSHSPSVIFEIASVIVYEGSTVLQNIKIYNYNFGFDIDLDENSDIYVMITVFWFEYSEAYLTTKKLHWNHMDGDYDILRYDGQDVLKIQLSRISSTIINLDPLGNPFVFTFN
jgi:hypothetical protein